MSIYHTMFEHLDAYIESLGGERSTFEAAHKWVLRELYHHNEIVMLLGAISMHTMALDRSAPARGEA